MKKILAFLLITTIASGCGWRLRGSVDSLETIGDVYLQVATNPLLEQQLKKTLTNSRAQLSANKSNAAFKILVSNIREERRTVAYNSNGSAAEYELRLEMLVMILGSDDKTLASNPISIERSYAFNPDDVLSKNQEERQLKEEMQKMAALQIVRQLQAAHRNASVENK
ncbi:MAG: hypothetical protein K6L73_00230 [Cellvibrionaceae bacterium]